MRRRPAPSARKAAPQALARDDCGVSGSDVTDNTSRPLSTAVDASAVGGARGGGTGAAARGGTGGGAHHSCCSAQPVTWLPQKPFDEAVFMGYLRHSLRARRLTNGGPLQGVLGRRLAAITGSTREVLPTASGSAAMHALCAAWELRRGRPLTWATAAFTFASAVQGPLAGARVVDLDARLGGPCLAALEAMRPPPDGVLLTNPLGLQADVRAYERWCERHGAVLLLDNAGSAIGELPDGRCIHDAGHGAIISLHETKPLGRGEGGAVFAPPEVAALVLRASQFGFGGVDDPARREAHRACGNWKASDVAAAAILTHLDAAQQAAWPARINTLLVHAAGAARRAGLSLAHDTAPGLELRLPSMPLCLFVALPPACREPGTASELAAALQAGWGIEARRYYRPLAPRAEAPRAWALFDGSICLPLHADMGRQDLERTLQALGAAAAAHAHAQLTRAADAHAACSGANARAGSGGALLLHARL